MDAVERHVTLPTDLDEAWALLTRPEDLAAWLGVDGVLDPTPGAVGQVVDPDGTRRRLVVDEVDEGHRLTWHWWPDDVGDGRGTASRVEITLVPTDGGTRVHVVEERLPQPSGGSTASPMRAAEAWSHRLLHLEALLLVAAAVRG